MLSAGVVEEGTGAAEAIFFCYFYRFAIDMMDQVEHKVYRKRTGVNWVSVGVCKGLTFGCENRHNERNGKNARVSKGVVVVVCCGCMLQK